MRFVHSMRGMGDNIYQRAFIKQMSGRVILDTPWPQLYEDLPNVTCVKPQTTLRTQAKNIKAYRKWGGRHTPSRGCAGIRVKYDERGIIPCMTQAFGFEPGPMDLPVGMYEPLDGYPRGKYVVVRPVTVRSEWVAETRNPLPEYVHEASVMSKKAGFIVISVADLADKQEWPVLPLPYADKQLHQGQLDVIKLMRLVANAAYVVGGIGWIVPAAMALNVPAWIICGGQGGYNSPWQLMNGPSKVQWAVPDNFCLCKEKVHSCDKRISDHAGQFTRFIADLV